LQSEVATGSCESYKKALPAKSLPSKHQGVDDLLVHEVLGEGEPLLFLHGLGADRRQSTSALQGLKNTKLIAPDFRAHGNSPYSSDDLLNFAQFADDVVAILDVLGIEKCNVGGLSMGSGVALNLALRYPERVKKIIILRPSWLDQVEPSHLKLVADAGELIKTFGLNGESGLEASDSYKKLLSENEKVALSINGVFHRPQASEAASVLYKMWQDKPFPSLESLKKIDKEALVLYTTRDELHPVSVAEAIFEALPKARAMKELAPRYYENALYTKQLREAIIEFLYS
jgi:pimeloyl-ACP methyl ester carboxylesterase